MIGTRIADRYRLDAPLGAGGMGSVFRATDERLGRPVAVKLLLPELATDMESIARFEREARTTAKLTHPGIVQTLDFGSEPGPGGRGRMSFLVMELADGETLAKVLAQGPLALGDAIAVGLQVLAALGAAHAAGIVHRDLKPENVMISRGGDGHVNAKLLDFGLAQIKSGTVYTRLTQTGAILGTPRYMAPEQARGEPCDVRTDVYAVGLVLHAALTARAPYDSESIAGIVSQVLETMPPRLDTVNPTVPIALARAIETAIQKAPAARFASTHAFATALDQTRALPAPVTTPEAFAPTGAMPSVEAPVPVLPAAVAAQAPVFAPPPLADEPLPQLPQRGSGGMIFGLFALLAFAGVGIGAFVFLDPMHLDLMHRAGAPPPTSLPSPAPSTAVALVLDAGAAVVVADPEPPTTHVSTHHAHVVPTTFVPPSTDPPATTTGAAHVPLIPVCRMAVHCCELVGGAHDACQTQPIGGTDAPPGGSPEVCPLTVASYHDVLVAQHLDASECTWPPVAAHALAAPTPTPAPAPTSTSSPSPQCAMATHCCLRTGGSHADCDAWGRMTTPDLCVQPIESYHRVLVASGEDASDCVWH